MLICSMGVSVDGFIADREGGFAWTAPDEALFRFHLAQIGRLGAAAVPPPDRRRGRYAVAAAAR